MTSNLRAAQSPSSARLVAAVEDVWAEIRARHSEVPPVVVALAGSYAGKGLIFGHFAPDRWVREDSRLPELFVGGEGLERGPVPVLGTLLHEATHGLADARGIKDTSRQGRYHNKRFASLAADMGIEVAHSQALGWSTTTVPQATADAYSHQVAALGAAITAYRTREFSVGPAGGRTSNNNPIALTCGCGRRIRAAATTIEAGPIVCGLCGEPFEAATR